MKKIFAFFSICLLPVACCLLPMELFAGQIKVVVSIHPLADITKQIGRQRVIVKTLLPPAASPHTFEPTPKDMMELWDAGIFVKIGAGLEFWAEKMVQAVSNRKLIVLDLSKDMPLIYSAHEHNHERDHSAGKIGRQADPHYWLDPVLVKNMADRIAGSLTRIDPAGGDFYKANAEAYKKELDFLNQEIKRKADRFMTKEYVTFHRAWDYFSKRYGLRVAGVIEESPGREPTPKDIAHIISELKRFRAKVVFAEPQFNPRIAEAVAKEAGARVLFLDPIGSPNAPDRDTYIKIMQYNISQMERAMR
ncbi:MAG: zinc ABC transporter substrate-binding protein [Nitrospirae bacterium]|nr:zinc ABC transporter substrate-binding protein [Nitrospirota bacterium]